MIKVILTKNDKFLKLSSLIDNKNKKMLLALDIVNCQISIVDDLIENGINECEIIFNLEAGALLKYILKFEGKKIKDSYTICPERSRIGANGLKKSFFRDLTVNLLGQNSKADLNIKITSLKEQQINLITKQIHLSSNTSSLLNIKNVMLKNSKFHCDNLIKIEKDLSNVTAIESSKVLSLVSDAQVIFKPKIEVDSQDVICKHEAAILGLNEEQIFYLQSRGMSCKRAKDFLLKSFLN